MKKTCHTTAPPLPQCFVGACMGGMLTEVVLRGVRGNGIQYDIVDSALSAIQGGVSYISYPLAVTTIASLSSKFKEIKDDPEKNQIMVYICGGSTATLMATAVNYPIQCFRTSRVGLTKKVKLSLKDGEKWYMDRLFPYVGFAASMGNIVPLLGTPKNSVHKWAQTHFMLQASHINGVLLAYPYQWMCHRVPFSQYLKDHLQSMSRRMICSDFSCYFKRTLAGLPQF